jgi:hypothetical protein
VNAAELDQEFKQMFRDCLETGILDGAFVPAGVGHCRGQDLAGLPRSDAAS